MGSGKRGASTEGGTSPNTAKNGASGWVVPLSWMVMSSAQATVDNKLALASTMPTTRAIGMLAAIPDTANVAPDRF